MLSVLRNVARQFDDKPVAAHLYVTDQCNLDCAYCTEYDNSVPHPDIGRLRLWVDKIAELGCLRIGLQGGEPLLHPDIVELVRHCKKHGLRTSMATNGFRLTAALAADLRDAGLDAVNISIDSVAPGPASRKSLKSLAGKLEILRESGLRFGVSGVLFEDSVAEARELIDYCVARAIPVQSRIVHAGVEGAFGVGQGDRAKVEALLDHQVALKRQGHPVKGVGLVEYQRAILRGRPLDWECIAGYKYFFVSARGKFWQCSMNRTPDIDLMDVTPDTLRGLAGPKPCQDSCGVYCIVGESIARADPLAFALAEAQGWQKRLARRLSASPA